MEWGTQCSVWGADILEVTFQILVNYCAESAAHGPGVPATPGNSILAALGTQGHLVNYLVLEENFPSASDGWVWRGLEGRGVEVREERYNVKALILHASFCNENSPLCFLDMWSKKFCPGHVIQKIQELPWCVFIYVLWILPTRGVWLWWRGDGEIS